MDNLPPEIVNEVLFYLSDSEILTCCLADKAFQVLSLRYWEIKISDWDLETCLEYTNDPRFNPWILKLIKERSQVHVGRHHTMIESSEYRCSRCYRIPTIDRFDFDKKGDYTYWEASPGGSVCQCSQCKREYYCRKCSKTDLKHCQTCGFRVCQMCLANNLNKIENIMRFEWGYYYVKDRFSDTQTEINDVILDYHLKIPKNSSKEEVLEIFYETDVKSRIDYDDGEADLMESKLNFCTDCYSILNIADVCLQLAAWGTVDDKNVKYLIDEQRWPKYWFHEYVYGIW